MGDEKSNKEKEVTPKGAVEIDDTDLDQAAGGATNTPVERLDRVDDRIDP